MTKKGSGAFPAVGGSSLLVIFAVLCLTIFSLLALSTVQAGGRLSQTSADAVAAYYQADTQAEEILARLRAGKIPDGVALTDDIYSYSCPISDTQALSVAVRMNGESYTILRWQAVSITDWTPDDSLPVWGGNTTN